MRKNRTEKRNVLPDPIYNSKLVTKAINAIMLDGKKGLAQKIVYDSFKIIETKTKEEGIEIFKKALNNIMPALELRVRRIAGS
ncbi:MAG: 30S ribosomal protein S7, partial [Bacilli bacterium]